VVATGALQSIARGTALLNGARSVPQSQACAQPSGDWCLHLNIV